jgi:hypothetical protein
MPEAGQTCSQHHRQRSMCLLFFSWGCSNDQESPAFCRRLVDGIFCLVASPLLDSVFESGAAIAKEKTKKIKPPKKRSKRPSLSYQPSPNFGQPKYPLRLGVLPLRDQRSGKFYGGTDAFFAEPVMAALDQTAFYEFKSSNLFQSVISIPEKAGTDLSRRRLADLALRHDVDLIFVGDVLVFNMLREKMRASKKGADFNIKVRFGMVGQLIDPRTGAVVWAEQVEREFSDLNSSGKVRASDYGGSAARAVKAGFSDIRKLITATGLEISQ